MQDVSSADGEAVDHSNDRLWEPSDLHLHVEHRQSRYAFAVDVSSPAFHVHVTSGAERLCAEPFVVRLSFETWRGCACEDDDPYLLRLSYDRESLRQLGCRERGEGVTIARTIDAYLCYAVVFFKDDFLERVHFFPVHIFFSKRVVNYSLRYSLYTFESISASVKTSSRAGRCLSCLFSCRSPSARDFSSVAVR